MGWRLGCGGPRAGPPDGAARRQAACLHRPGVAVSTVHGDCRDGMGAWRAAATSRSCLPCRGWIGCWTSPRWPACWSGSGAWPRVATNWGAPLDDRRTKDPPSHAQRAFNRVQAGCAPWESSRSPSFPTPGRCVAGAAVPGADVFRATAALVGLGRWLHRIPMRSSSTDTLNEWNGGDAIDMPPELPGGPRLIPMCPDHPRSIGRPASEMEPRLAAATASPTRPWPHERSADGASLSQTSPWRRTCRKGCPESAQGGPRQIDSESQRGGCNPARVTDTRRRTTAFEP
jgi:hypothetical protein